jgi:hypothetical protein
MATPILPSFTPGSGWYKPGSWAPGCDADRDGMRAAAFPCTVVVLRRRGVRLTPSALLLTDPPSGLLVCQDRYTQPMWHANLFADKTMERTLLPQLMHVQLVKENAGVRQYRGTVAENLQEFAQEWLCTPTPGRAREILLDWAEQIGDDVE